MSSSMARTNSQKEIDDLKRSLERHQEELRKLHLKVSDLEGLIDSRRREADLSRKNRNRLNNE